MSNKLLTAHLKEANSRSAEITNLGLFTSEDEIESKTTAGRLRTKIEKGAIKNEWYGDNVEMKLEEFNNCPGKEAVQKQLKELGIADYIEIADAPMQYWQNESDTLVLKMKTGMSWPFEVGLAFTKLMTTTNPDEFDSEVKNYTTYIRMWWD